MLAQIALACAFNATEGFDLSPGAEFAQTLVRNHSDSVLTFIAALTFSRLRLPSPLGSHLVWIARCLIASKVAPAQQAKEQCHQRNHKQDMD
jgi:hypothetical protein